MQHISEKKNDSQYWKKSKETPSIEFQQERLEKISSINTKDEERRRLEKWKIGRKNFP